MLNPGLTADEPEIRETDQELETTQIESPERKFPKADEKAKEDDTEAAEILALLSVKIPVEANQVRLPMTYEA